MLSGRRPEIPSRYPIFGIVEREIGDTVRQPGDLRLGRDLSRRADIARHDRGLCIARALNEAKKIGRGDQQTPHPRLLFQLTG